MPLLALLARVRKPSRDQNSSTISSAYFLKKIDYPGVNNFSQFSYDGLWRNTKIVETVSGSVNSTKQFVWSNDGRREERDSGGTLTKKFFGLGQTISGTSYFYAKPLLDSITEMTDGSGAVQAQYSFDPYGRAIKLQGGQEADLQFAGYYLHGRSGLNLALARAYSSISARFINRDPIDEMGGANLYAYVKNSPINHSDPRGTLGVPSGGSSAAGGASSLSSTFNRFKCECTDYCKQHPEKTTFGFDLCVGDCMNTKSGSMGPPAPPPTPQQNPPTDGPPPYEDPPMYDNDEPLSPQQGPPGGS